MPDARRTTDPRRKQRERAQLTEPDLRAAPRSQPVRHPREHRVEQQGIRRQRHDLEADRGQQPPRTCSREAVTGAGDELIDREHDAREQRQRKHDPERAACQARQPPAGVRAVFGFVLRWRHGRVEAGTDATVEAARRDRRALLAASHDRCDHVS
jgi:hypothetical protein